MINLTEASALNLKNQEERNHFTQGNLDFCIKESMKYLGKYHFLTNQETFDQCKHAFQKTTFLNIYLNLLDGESCARLNRILTRFGAKLTLANITNIHAYVSPKQIKESVDRLLENKQSPLIIYSEQINEYDELRAICVNDSKELFAHERWGLGDRYNRFLGIVASYPKVIDHFIAKNHNFSKINKEKKPKNCNELSYIGYEAGATSIKNVLANKEELRCHPSDFNLQAHITVQEAKEYVIKDRERLNAKYNIQKQLDDYWIITFRGKKEKINQRLRFFNNEFVTDQYTSRLQLFSRAICATNSDQSKVIEKEEAIKEMALTL